MLNVSWQTRKAKPEKPHISWQYLGSTGVREAMAYVTTMADFWLNSGRSSMNSSKLGVERHNRQGPEGSIAWFMGPS